MKIKVLILLCIAALGYGTKTEAQQDAQYTEYLYNTMAYNPAYAGSRGAFSTGVLYRTQWVGINGAPDTSTISFHTPLGRNEKVGLGFSVVNDKIGPSSETYFDVNFSYTIRTSEEGKLAFGIRGGGHLLDVDFNKLTAFDLDDNLLQTNIDNKFSPNMGVGVYYHQPNYYVGLSAPNLIETEHFDRNANSGNASSYLARERINYYLLAGYVFEVSSNLKLKPALITKMVQGAPLQVDLSATALISDKFSLGAAYRWSAALSAIVGFQVSNNLMLGYAYDGETTNLAQFNTGSHEIFMRFEISKRTKFISSRFF